MPAIGPDLFGDGPAQASLFGDTPDRIPHAAPAALVPDVADVRHRLETLLATARAAEQMPWGERKARLWQIVFPQMANWLPDDEADQLRFAFAREIERLKAAA